MRKLIIISLFCLTYFTAKSQSTMELGVFVGASGYMGDLNPINPLQVTDPAFGVLAKQNFNPRWSLKVGFLHGKVQANDANSNNANYRNRNINFFSSINELSAQVEFNFFEYVPSLSKKRYSPFLFTGVGFFIFDPKAKYDNGSGPEVYTLKDEMTEGQQNPYKTYSFSVPYGAGVKYNISGKWSLIGEIGYRTAFTDYLDDVSGDYPSVNPMLIPSDPSGTAVPGTQRGDYRKNDTYFFTGLSITYTFINPVFCFFK